jgi:hypothetical protein
MTKPAPGIQEKAPPADIKERADLPKEERALDQALDESMDASDPPGITQPGKNFVGPRD